MATVTVISRGEAEARRAELLRNLPISEATLRDRASRYELSARELAIFEQLEELDFLLGA